MSNQPKWQLIANLGDVNPIDYGGLFVYRDLTGVYPEECELLESPDSDDDPSGWTVYRFILDKCTLENGILSDNPYHPDHAAWFSKPESERNERPQDTTYLSNVADFIGQSVDDLASDFCSDDPLVRAMAYEAIGRYHGFENLDAYPLQFNRRGEVERRYGAALRGLAARTRKA